MFVCVAAHTQPQRLSRQQQNRVRPLLVLPETLRSLVHSRTRTLEPVAFWFAFGFVYRAYNRYVPLADLACKKPNEGRVSITGRQYTLCQTLNNELNRCCNA